VFKAMQKVTGVDLLRDLSGFFRALGGMIDGFTERARSVGALLQDPATTFLIVTAPRHDPVEEAIFFHRKLREAGMPFGGLVVNRVHQPPDDGLPEPVAAELGPALAERVSAAAAQLGALAARDAGNVARLRSALDDPPTLVIPELEDDVHDLDGLAAVRAHLFTV
jgi:anion-transporting  ArsA/GET3 family ATPase